MKEGKYFRIPEGPADLEQLWGEAEALVPAHLPEWLTPEDAGSYRALGRNFLGTMLSAREQSAYLAEVSELEAAGLIADPEPAYGRAHRIYIAAPDTAEEWSIGIYEGESPFALLPVLEINNPVLTRAQVSDVPAVFVADPFMVRVNDTWHMFFEVMNWRTGKGEIGLAVSADGWHWTYRQIVLAEPFHLSYPYVFEWHSDYYMVPESYQAHSIRLYKARHFPWEWSWVGTLLTGPYLVDGSLFRHDGQWWLFAETNPDERHDTLRLYSAVDLLGPWRQHPQSPIVQANPHIARPAGRVLRLDNRIIRFAQNCHPSYGMDVRAFEVTELTGTSYREREVDAHPILGPSGSGWNACGMHHIDAHPTNNGRWLACVDGWSGAPEGKNR